MKIQFKYDGTKAVKNWQEFLKAAGEILSGGAVIVAGGPVATGMGASLTAGGLSRVFSNFVGKDSLNKLATNLVTQSIKYSLLDFMAVQSFSEKQRKAMLHLLRTSELKGFLVIEQKHLELKDIYSPYQMMLGDKIGLELQAILDLPPLALNAKWRVAINNGFHKAWAEHHEEYEQILKYFSPPNFDSIFSSWFFEAHGTWIDAQYTKNIMEEKFSIDKIYVPIQVVQDGNEDDFSDWVPNKPKDFLENALKTANEKTHPCWHFIKGSPGSGKSVLALKIAHDLVERSEVIPIFVRFSQTSNKIKVHKGRLPEICDDRFSLQSLLKTAMELPQQQILLILDGLDEIGAKTNKIQEDISVALQIVQDGARNLCAYGKKVTVIVFGRETITQATSNLFIGEHVNYTMGDLSGHLINDNLSAFKLFDDLRGQWWEAFQKARKLPISKTIPSFLASEHHELYELGREPLLAYLICLTAMPEEKKLPKNKSSTNYINDRVAAKNRNDLYAQIIDQVRSSKKWRGQTAYPSLFTGKRFVNVLKYIALATWQEGGNRIATIGHIRSVIFDKQIRSDFDKLSTNLSKNKVQASSNLLSTFYFRIHGREKGTDHYQFEFTHKTFSEYLLATLLFDRFENLIQLRKENDIEGPGYFKEYHEALIDWIKLTETGPETNDIANFIIDEAQLRYSNHTFDEWCLAFGIISDILFLRAVSKRKRNWRKAKTIWFEQVENVHLLKRATQICFMLWGALNQTRFKNHSAKVFEMDTYEPLRCDLIKLIQPISYYGEFQEGEPNAIEGNYFLPLDITPSLTPSFFGYCFSAVKLVRHDLSGFSINGGEIENFQAIASSFIRSNWNNVIIDNGIFEKSNFAQSAIIDIQFFDTQLDECVVARCVFQRIEFNRLIAVDSDFSQSDFCASSFEKCKFSNITFDCCTFNECSFDHCTFDQCSFVRADLNESGFQNCTFKNCDFEGAFTKGTSHENCVGLDIKA